MLGLSGTVAEASARPKWGFEASLTLLSPREVRGRSLRAPTLHSHWLPLQGGVSPVNLQFLERDVVSN